MSYMESIMNTYAKNYLLKRIQTKDRRT